MVSGGDTENFKTHQNAGFSFVFEPIYDVLLSWHMNLCRYGLLEWCISYMGHCGWGDVVTSTVLRLLLFEICSDLCCLLPEVNSD